MNDIYRILRRYIREAIDLGNIQFSPNRVDGVSIEEPNTPEEDKLYDVLLARLNGNQQIDNSTAKKLVQLMKSKKYGMRGSGFFSSPDPSKLLYRGHAYTQTWAEKHIADPSTIPLWYTDTPRERILKNPPLALDPPYNFGPQDYEGFRGWSPDIVVASDFAADYARRMVRKVEYAKKYASFYADVASAEKEYVKNNSKAKTTSRTFDPSDKVYAVVLVVDPKLNPPDALLDFSSGVYKTTAAHGYRNEKEVMNIKPVKCHAAFVVQATFPEDARLRL